MLILPEPIEFEWDLANRGKSLRKYRVTAEECEEIFFDPHKRILKDVLHSAHETRYILLGRTQKSRYLFLVFTIRKNRVRLISARDLNRKERKLL